MGSRNFVDERKILHRADGSAPLSEEGRTQIRALGETFAGRRIEKIYTSPLKALPGVSRDPAGSD